MIAESLEDFLKKPLKFSSALLAPFRGGSPVLKLGAYFLKIFATVYFVYTMVAKIRRVVCGTEISTILCIIESNIHS